MSLPDRKSAKNKANNANPGVESGIIRRLAQRFRKDATGNVSLIFGLAAIPLFVAAGMAVDTARHGFHQQRLNTSVDAAALAVAKMEDGATQEEMENLARSYIDINYTPRVDLQGNVIDLTVSLVGNVVTVTAEVDVPTTITGLIGITDMVARTTSEVTKEILGTEIALVLDNTGSMSGSKIDALEDASDTLLDVLFNGVNSTNKLKVAIVPFSAAVNVGTDKSAETWLDTGGLSEVATMNFTEAGWHNWRGWQEIPNRSWNGCVQARAMPFDIQDDLPTTGNPDTLFAPYFAPDEPDNDDNGVKDHASYNDSYTNDYLSDGVDEDEDDLDLRQYRSAKYVNTPSSNSDGKGPGYNCGIAPITALTNVEADLRSAVDAMVATGYTNITQGIAWGWHVLSPAAPFSEGKEYNNQAWKKYMVVMTDGNNDWGKRDNHDGTRYTGYGHIAQDRLDETNHDNHRTVLDDRTASICTNVKAASGSPSTAITVYTITFGDIGTDTRDMMEACATDSEKYHHAPNSAALTAVFEQIADEIGSIRLSE